LLLSEAIWLLHEWKSKREMAAFRYSSERLSMAAASAVVCRILSALIAFPRGLHWRLPSKLASISLAKLAATPSAAEAAFKYHRRFCSHFQRLINIVEGSFSPLGRSMLPQKRKARIKFNCHFAIYVDLHFAANNGN